MSKRPTLTPMELLMLLFVYGPVPRTMFGELQERENVRIETSALRVLRKQGWIHDMIHFAWLLTDKGRAKVRALEQATQ